MSGHPQPPAEPSARAQTTPRQRDKVFLFAQVAGAPHGMPTRHLVRNLSATGACIAEPVGLEKFERLIVSMGQLDNVQAEVAWARGGFAGVRFLKPIDVTLARKHRVAGAVMPTSASGPVGWLSEHRRPHQKVWG